MKDLRLKPKENKKKVEPKQASKVAVFFSRLMFRIELALSHERDFFVENLSMLLSSGMTITSAVHSIADEVKGRAMRRVLQTLAEDVENGSSLWRAFENSGIFPAHVIALVRIGEESGKLSDNLKLVAIQAEKDRAFKSKIKSAMMYPVFIFTVTVVVGVLIMWFILPRLSTVFGQLRLELPAITKALISTGQFLGQYGAVVVPVFFIFIGFTVYFIFFYPKTKHIGQKFLLAFPGVGRLLKEIEISRFGYLLGTLLSAGIPVVTALDSMSKATTFPVYRDFYKYLAENISDGNSFEKSFSLYAKTGALLPRGIQGLIVAGEKSGALASTLLKLSERYESRIEDTTKNLTVIFEPILLVIVWVGVVMVALSVILPIYSLIGGINN